MVQRGRRPEVPTAGRREYRRKRDCRISFVSLALAGTIGPGVRLNQCTPRRCDWRNPRAIHANRTNMGLDAYPERSRRAYVADWPSRVH